MARKVTGRWSGEIRVPGVGYQEALPDPASFAPAPIGITGPENTRDVSGSGAEPDPRVLVDCDDFTILAAPNGQPPAVQWVTEHFLGVPFALFEHRAGSYRKYRRSAQWGHIIVAWDGIKEGMGVHVHVQGEGCRQLEAWEGFPGWLAHFGLVFAAGGQFARIDLAVDDRADLPGAGLLDLDKMIRCKRPVPKYPVQDGAGGLRVPTRIRTCLRKVSEIDQCDASSGVGTGRGVYLGGDQGDVKIRAYDKAMQKGLEVHWVRVEAQLRDERANEAVKHMLELGVGPAACGILRRYVAFVRPTRDRNFDRWPLYEWWERFLGQVEPLRLSKVEAAVTLEESLLWVDNACGPTLGTALMAMGGDLDALWNWFLGVVQRGVTRLKTKHRARVTAWRVATGQCPAVSLDNAQLLPVTIRSSHIDPLPPVDLEQMGKGLLSVLKLTNDAWGLSPSPAG